MKLGFEESHTSYSSGSQNARVWTERWVADWVYCVNCGSSQLSQFPNNSPVADFFCPRCSDQFEVKATKKPTGMRVADGAYATKMERLQSATNPNLLLLTYDAPRREVRSVCVVPKHFFTPDIIERRKALSVTARRPGWVGSNILVGKVPEAGRIFLLRDGRPESREDVLAKWQHSLFLRDVGGEKRGWLIEVMKVVETLGKASEFTLDEVYAYEHHLAATYPNNNNVRPKIRQQLQVLRDAGFLDFLGRGKYRLRTLQ
ncbi:MAG TPA: DpnI domain-containing protein [Devosia sp.]|jgi:type II restriction enzyme|nr:DpnI domain-containing protein [Devosia sp.]